MRWNAGKPLSTWIARAELETILTCERHEFVATCVKLIVVERSPNEKADVKKSPPFGFGPDDYLRVCQSELNQLNIKLKRTLPNPFINIFLGRKLSKSYLTKSRRMLIMSAICFVMVSYRLYQELTQIADELSIEACNTQFTLDKLRFEILKKSVIPFVSTVAGLLQRDNLLTPRAQAMYQHFLALSEVFHKDVLDRRLALPHTTHAGQNALSEHLLKAA